MTCDLLRRRFGAAFFAATLLLALVGGCAINPIPTPGGDASGGGLPTGADAAGADTGSAWSDTAGGWDAGPPPQDVAADVPQAADTAPPEDIPAPSDVSPDVLDAEPDADVAPPPPLVVPFVPPLPEEPWVDTPFVQETNHTTPEVEPGVGPLVAVLWPPAAWDGWDRPTQVALRGVVRHDAVGALGVVAIPADHPDLLDAVAMGDVLVLVGPHHAYLVDAAGAVTDWPAPEDVTNEGVHSVGAAGAYISATPREGFVPPGGAPTWPDVPALPGQPTGPLTAAAADGEWTFVARGDEIVATRRDLGCQWQVSLAGVAPIRALVPTVTLPEPLALIVTGDGGVAGVRVTGGCPDPTVEVVDSPLFAADRVPLDSPRAAARTSDGGFVVATAGGACRLMDRGHGLEWRVYNQERWLPGEDVRDVLVEPDVSDGRLWFATSGGLATVTAERVTLEEKLAPFVTRIVLRHDRDGAVADSHLTRRGDVTSNIPWDSDNDGTWTSYWVMGECFRWSVTGAEDARVHFDRSLDAMLRLRDLTGTDHFVARAVIRKEGCLLDDCDDPDDGEWFSSPDGAWWVKGDTSNDEIVSHVLMMGLAYDLCADEAQQERIRDHIGGIIGGIVDHGYQLVDLDGEVTTYGQFDPVYVNEHPAGRFGDGGVRAAEVLAGLTLASYLTGDPRFDAAKRALIEDHAYDEATRLQAEYAVRFGNSDADRMGAEALFVLLRYETDAALRDIWLDGWRRQYATLRVHQAAWWDAIDAVVGEPTDLSYALRWLRLAPVDMIRWNVHNSHRHDVSVAPGYFDTSAGVRTDGLILPYDERRCDRWNTDQFRVDGGMGGGIEMDGADVLAPYWMLRQFGFFTPEEG